MLVQAGTIDAFLGIGVCFNAATVDFGAALATDAVVTGIYSLQCGGNLGNLLAGFVAQCIHNLAVLELLRPLFRVGLISASQVCRDALQTRRQFLLLLFELAAQSVVRV